MLITTFYLAMTFINAWRMRSLKSHLLKFMSWKSSAVLYKFSSGIGPLKAKLIIERKVHYITDVIEITEATRMCRLRPIQFIDINRWISLANGLPFWPRNIFQQPDSSPKLCVFIECEMEPCTDETLNDIVPLESLGQVWAWRADKNLEFIVVIPFNKLLELSYKFLYGSLLINEKLPVIRIQTVYATGIPYQPDEVKIYPLRKIVCEAHRSSCGIDWAYYSAILKQMCRDVFPHTVKTSTSKAVGDYTISTSREQATNTNEYTNSNHSDHEETQKLIRELSEELSIEPIIESQQVKKIESSPQKPFKKEENAVNSSQKGAQECADNKGNAIEPMQKQQLESVDSIERKRRPLQKQSQEAKSEPIQEVRPKLTHQSKQESLQKNTEEPKQEANEATIVRSEVVAIRQKISPSRKRNTTGNVATTIESVTTHRRVTTLVPPTQGRQTPSPERSNVSSGEKRRTDLPKSNALNVLVYSESLVAKNNLIATLKNVLDPDRYTIYPVSLEVLSQGAWKGKVAMIAVVGNTGDATAYLLKYFLDGGRLLAICSDLLQSVVPYYRTAEIRENEIVQFSYDKWKSVKMKHHVLCFQASPAKKQFSSESDRHVMEHELVIDVLANEETWRTPSLIQVVDDTKHGVSIFSQIHLETNPAEYLGEDGPKNNKNRYEILSKILGDIISLHVKDTDEMATLDYTEGYIFGDDETVQSFLSGLSPGKGFERHLKISNMEIEWLAPGQEATHPPSQNYMPVHLSQVPDTFSYETYLQNLTSTSVGRVVFYTEVVGSTAAWGEVPLGHGLAVVARRQLQGRGRSQNHFISPPGQAILTLQVWQKLNDNLALTQNVAALAAVLAIRSGTQYEPIDIRIKWPNDIYYGRLQKIGGVSTAASVMGDTARINMGIGVNISNSVPTTCVNDIIREYNVKHNATLEEVNIEWFLGRFCSHFERILEGMATEEGQKAFFEEYYKYWLHNKEEITVINKEGRKVCGTIAGMDRHGFLRVDTTAGQLTVNPDGNSFDIMANLIVTKYT